MIADGPVNLLEAVKVSVGKTIIIGLTGPFGAGCSEIAKDLHSRRSFRKYSFHEAIGKVAPLLIPNVDTGKLSSRKHRAYQQDIGNEIRRKDINAIPEHLVKKIQEDENKDASLKSADIVLDGIRNSSEITYLRDTFLNFFVIAVFASYSTRWNRNKTDYDENEGTFRRDDEQDSGQYEPAWGQQVQLCVDRSDILISNDREFADPSMKEEFQSQIDSHIQLMKNPGSRKPHIWEWNMAQAYTASLMSSCCKRKVGAVVVREKAVDDQPSRSYMIASGYNEAPLGVRRCEERGGTSNPQYCRKDEKIKEVVRDQYKCCPKCGQKVTIPDSFGLPFICSNTDCGARLGRDFIPGRMLDLCVAVHAEQSAVLQASKFGRAEVDGSTLYTTTFPCPLCARMLVYAGLQQVLFAEPYPQDDAINALEEAGVEAVLFEGVKGRAYNRLFELPPKP